MKHCGMVAGLWLCASGALSLPAPPASLAPGPAVGPNRVYLDWSAAAGAASYNVKRSIAPGGPHGLLANVATPYYSDTTPSNGVVYYYAVTAVSNAAESPSFREAAASPGVVADNTDPSGISSTGSWPASGLAGCYGTNSQYAATTANSSPTATFRFTPVLPFFAHYDVYLRWPSYSNRATNTPVDVWYADGMKATVALDQTQGGNTWVLLGTYACAAGGYSAVEVRNNTGSADAYVGADAVQFVPRLAPWGPRADALEDYTVTKFSDECNGSVLNTSLWALALGRTNVSAGSGKISLDVDWIGDTPVGSATDAELQDPNNWAKGAVKPVHDQKYGYFEARFRVVQAGGGVDNAFWMPDRGGLLPYEGYELDSPEAFPDATLADTSLIYGMWDHRGGSPPWRMNSIHYDHDWAVRYHVYGMEWQTDNTLVHYLDGEVIGTAPASAINSIGCMAPADIDLSCYVGNYWQPAATINGQSMKVDYLRCYQKPGWTGGGGAASPSWGEPRNWGPDGVPGSGEAAVFNLPTTQSVVSILGTKSVHSLCFEGQVAAMTITGAYPIQLGSGGNSIEQGGISMGSEVAFDQTIDADLVGLQNLSFLNNSLAGASLILNGVIDGATGGPLRRVHFAANQPIAVSRPLGSRIGDVVKWGPSVFAMPSNSAHVGRTLLAEGTVDFNHAAPGGQPSGLGASSANPTNLLLYPRTKHGTESYRPRLRYTGPAATTDRGLTLGYFCDGILEASGSGPIVWTGPLVFDPGSTATAVLEFGGTNTGSNTFAGAIRDTGVVNPSGDSVSLRVRKVGAGTWVLNGSNVWTGATEVNDGTLVLNGSLGSSSGLTVTNGATLSGRGVISVPATVRGTLAPGDPGGTLRCASLDFTAGSRLGWRLGGNTAAGAGMVTGSTIAVATGAVLDVVLDGPGSAVNFADGFWRGTQTWRVVAAGAMTGGFSLGAVSEDAGGHGTAAYGSFGLGQDASGVSLVWTPVPATGYERYAQQIAEAGHRGEGDDPDGDGYPNLLEYVTGGNPTLSDSCANLSWEQSGGAWRLRFARATNSTDARIVVEAAYSLLDPASWTGIATNDGGSWGSGTNVTETGPGSPAVVHVQDNGPAATNRFMRLRVTRP